MWNLAMRWYARHACKGWGCQEGKDCTFRAASISPERSLPEGSVSESTFRGFTGDILRGTTGGRDPELVAGGETAAAGLRVMHLL